MHLGAVRAASAACTSTYLPCGVSSSALGDPCAHPYELSIEPPPPSLPVGRGRERGGATCREGGKGASVRGAWGSRASAVQTGIPRNHLQENTEN
eukprot:1087979-Rhodomonas_salina.2